MNWEILHGITTKVCKKLWSWLPDPKIRTNWKSYQRNPSYLSCFILYPIRVPLKPQLSQFVDWIRFQMFYCHVLLPKVDNKTKQASRCRGFDRCHDSRKRTRQQSLAEKERLNYSSLQCIPVISRFSFWHICGSDASPGDLSRRDNCDSS